MARLVAIGKAAEALGVSVQTLRRWEREGRISGVARTEGGSRRYDVEQLRGTVSRLRAAPIGNVVPETRRTIAYARVSSHGQKDDLERQKRVLELHCAARGWTFEIVSDLGSGLNYRKRGLRKLIDDILGGEVGRLVLTHKDRLLRFGAELIFSLCEAKGVEVVILNQGDDTSFEEDLAKDVLEIITVFSARLYGARSRKNARLIEGVEQALRSVADPEVSSDA
jgi:putative resolvase